MSMATSPNTSLPGSSTSSLACRKTGSRKTRSTSLVKSGIKFRRHEVEGIEPYEFAQLLMTSGLVLLDNVKWLTFHSGYDFGYLLEMLTGQNLPVAETDFFETLKLYFPCIYDVKYLMKSCGSLRGGLQEVAGQLQIERVGLQHQAGSDSLLTGETFFQDPKSVFSKTSWTTRSSVVSCTVWARLTAPTVTKRSKFTQAHTILLRCYRGPPWSSIRNRVQKRRDLNSFGVLSQLDSCSTNICLLILH
ncbi:hypothetical protein MRX96_014591 [Rhipicephalus microplus]